MTSTMQSTNNIRLRVRVWGRTFRLPVPTHASFADLSQLLAKRLELPPTAAFQFSSEDGDQLSAADQITDVIEEDETLTARAAPPSKASVPPAELELITVPVVLGGSAPAADEATTTLSETVDGWVVIQTRSKPDSTSTAQPVEHRCTAVAANSFELLDRGAEFTGRGEARSAEASAEGKPNLPSKAAKKNARRKQKRQEQHDQSTLRASLVLWRSNQTDQPRSSSADRASVTPAAETQQAVHTQPVKQTGLVLVQFEAQPEHSWRSTSGKPSFRVELHVPEVARPAVIGHRGSSVKQLEQQHQVKLSISGERCVICGKKPAGVDEAAAAVRTIVRACEGKERRRQRQRGVLFAANDFPEL